MKKIKFVILPLFALILGFGLSAYTTSPSKSSTSTELHWFDVNTGNYLGFLDISDIENGDCSGTGVDCARGYEQVIDPDPEGDPLPDEESFVQTLQKD